MIGEDAEFAELREQAAKKRRLLWALLGNVVLLVVLLGGPFARGILYIRPGDFATQLTTFRGSPRAVARFGRLFASTLWRTYRGGRPG